MELLYYFLPTLFILLIVKLLVQTKKNLPPSPFAIPILGHLHLFKLPLNRTLQALTNQYGPILFLRFGSRPVLVISSQSLAEECFTKNDIIFANRPHTITGDRLSYNYTIFTWSSYGHHWRNMRRITTIEIFSSKSLQMSYAIRKEEIHCLVKNLYQSSNCGLQHFDLKFQFSKLMFNTVMRMVAGKRFFEDFMDLDEQKQVHVHLKAIFAPFMFLNMEDFLPIIKWIGLNGRENNMIKVQKKRDSFLQDMINEYRQKINSSSTSVAEEKNKTTIIGALLSIQEAEPEYYSDEIIKGIILSMFTAGTDTTTLTMEWAMSLLLNHPNILHKALSEIDSQVQGRLLDDSDLAKLPYLHCIINETLRLYPAAPLLLPHISSEECTVGGYSIPRGTILLANAWAIQRDPNMWVEPKTFMPERFEGVQGEKEMGFKFLPFGVGRRGCPGAALAMRVVALALGTFIQCFEWERVGGDQVDMNENNTGVTMPKANPLIATCKPRPGVVSALSQI
ncbi:hypothetical protein IFM89_005056 [Coptis chinensis]|uniref:Cytochrome P450 n=1 Tax=Coptis chinensis TaxID=261450 RepID=A0A835LPN2_9MAGN|nr:hypothetical protein IFM89_005056 [Coptis chinensis]